jgi:hypothetical protein
VPFQASYHRIAMKINEHYLQDGCNLCAFVCASSCCFCVFVLGMLPLALFLTLQFLRNGSLPLFLHLSRPLPRARVTCVKIWLPLVQLRIRLQPDAQERHGAHHQSSLAAPFCGHLELLLLCSNLDLRQRFWCSARSCGRLFTAGRMHLGGCLGCVSCHTLCHLAPTVYRPRMMAFSRALRSGSHHAVPLLVLTPEGRQQLIRHVRPKELTASPEAARESVVCASVCRFQPTCVVTRERRSSTVTRGPW